MSCLYRLFTEELFRLCCPHKNVNYSNAIKFYDLLLMLNYVMLLSEIEAHIRDIQAKRKAAPAPVQDGDVRVGLGEEGHYAQDIYEMSRGRGKMDDYVTSIPATDEQAVSSNLAAENFFCTSVVVFYVFM